MPSPGDVHIPTHGFKPSDYIPTQGTEKPVARCRRCGRKLKSDASIRAGYGTFCAKKMKQRMNEIKEAAKNGIQSQESP